MKQQCLGGINLVDTVARSVDRTLMVVDLHPCSAASLLSQDVCIHETTGEWNQMDQSCTDCSCHYFPQPSPA